MVARFPTCRNHIPVINQRQAWMVVTECAQWSGGNLKRSVPLGCTQRFGDRPFRTPEIAAVGVLQDDGIDPLIDPTQEPGATDPPQKPDTGVMEGEAQCTGTRRKEEGL